MRLCLAGSRSFGRAVAQRLDEEGHKLVQVVSLAPDDPVAVVGVNAGASWADAASFGADALADDVDLIVCAHSHAFIGRKTRDRTPHGAIGYHPSLLPRHRGRDAVRWTIKMHDPIAGGSVYQLTNNVDAGPVISQHWLHVGADWDHHRLWREMFPIAVDLLASCVRLVEINGIVLATPQVEEFATWEPSWERPPVKRPDLLALPPSLA